MNLLTQLLHPHASADSRRAEIYKSLIHWEAQIGGQLFGPVPDGVRREFFCLDKHTWVWHEEWTDKTGRHSMTTRYDIRPTGIVKSQGDSAYQSMTDQELKNFFSAVELYRQKIVPELNRMNALGRGGK